MPIGKLHALSGALCGLILTLCAGFALAQGAPPRGVAQTPRPAPVAGAEVIAGVDARLTVNGEQTRFTIALSGVVAARFEVLSQPMRIIAELPEISFQAAPPARSAGLVAGFRAGLVAPGRSRIIFELARPARVAGSRLLARAGGVHDLVIDFEPVAQSEFDRLASQGAEERARAALAPLVPQPQTGDRRPLIVIDPGHGGIDSGAVAAGGVLEKNIVLAIALRLREEIERGGFARVQMTRADDRFLSLSERVRIAREGQAALLISLHADSLSAEQEVRGATVYTLSDRASDAEAARLAQKENAADAVGGADTVEAASDVADILNDLARRETRLMTGSVATTLVTELSGAIRMHRIPLRSAGFRVLAAPDVPSVLIELGYLSSRGDIGLLTSAEWQTTAAKAITAAVQRHLAVRTAQ